MQELKVHVTARPRADGLDFERLALAFLEVVEDLPEDHLNGLATEGERVIRAAQRDLGIDSVEGAA